MVSSFNENELIDILLFEYNKSNYQRFLENEINIIVNYNTIGENQEIIVHYVGDVYDAMKLYNNNKDNDNDKKIDIDNYNNKELFYKDLAYISLYTFLQATIQDLIKK
jgi:hypothetical protein